MTKTKQWILSVIFAAVLVSALFFGIMLSDPVYITARAEVSPRAASTISLNDIQTVSTYVVDDMTWEIGVVGAEDANVWRLNKQFKEFFAGDNGAPEFTKDDEFYQFATINAVQRIENGQSSSVTIGDIVSSGTYTVTVKLAENSKYQFANVQTDGSSTDSFMLNVMERAQIQLNNVTLRMPLTEGASWSFTDVVNALREDKLNGATDINNIFLGSADFYSGLQVTAINGANGVVYDGATTMTVGVYQVKLGLPQGSAYVWSTAAGADTFSLTVYQNVSLTDVRVLIDYTENLYWQTNTETAGRSYLTPASDAFKQGVVNPSQSIQNLFTDEFLGNLRIATIRNFSNYSQIALGTAVNAGSYELTLEFVNQNGLYQWTDANANQILLEVAKKKINLGSYANMHFALTDGSELLSDPVYQYTYTTAGSSEVQTYYSLTQLTYAPNSQWRNWTYVTQTQSQYSVARYTGTTVQIQVVFGGLGALMDGATYVTATSIKGMQYMPNRTSSSQVSKQQASVVLTLSNDSNYIFDEKIDSSVAGDFALNRGLIITFSNGNQTATITKDWFAAASHNILMDSESSGNQVEFSVPDWTFGQNPFIAAPRLAHVAASQGEFGGYTATLTNLDTDISYSNITANNWADYFNRFMPAGHYQLLINVATTSVSGVHQDWWNSETHNIGDVTFLAHNASYNFTVSKEILEVDESAVNAFNQSGDFNTKVVTGSGAIDYSKLFASVSKLSFTEGSYLTAADRQANGGHWANENGLFDNAPVCVFKTLDMIGDSYYTATDSIWSSQFTRVGSYTVLYKVTMKNYVTVGDVNPYEHYFHVSLCRVITQTPVLATLSYNGTNQTPYLINSDEDRVYYEVVAGQSFMEVGTHTVRVAIKDAYKAYVMWSETDQTGITTVQLTINPTENFWRVSPRINDWHYGDAIPSPEGDAFYFNVQNGDTKTFKYYRVDGNGDLIDPNSADTRLERFAVNGQIPIGRYALVTVITVGANVGYSGLSTQNGGYYIFEVRPAANFWVSAPFMADIVYGEYDSRINQPTATAYQYNPDLGDHIQYQFRKADENGTVDWRTPPINLSKDTPIGRYALITTFTVGDGNQNYGAVNDGVYTISYFYVLPTSNSLIVNPVTTWQYGAYTDEALTQTAKAKFFNAESDQFVYTYFEAELKGGVVVKKDNAQAKTINDLKVQGIVPAGFYILELQLLVNGDGSYSGLNQEYTIEVTQTANHWTEFPRIASWSVGDTPNVPQAKAAFGTANIVIKSGNTIMYTTADGWINPCVAGYYTLEATVDGTRDYAGIPTYRTEFRVFQAGNSGTSVDKVVDGVNVKVDAAIVTGTQVNVSAIATDDAAYQKVKTALESRDMTVCAGYKVEFVLNGETIPADGRVTVTITLDDELKGKVGLSAYDANGVALGSVLNADGTITFSTTNPEGCFIAYSANSGSTDAGFIIALVAMIILIVGLVVVAVFVIRNAQKQKLEEDEYDEDEEEDEE